MKKFEIHTVDNVTNYDLLKKLPGNRDTTERKDLEDAMRRNGFRDPVKVGIYTGSEIPKGKYNLDGQNRIRTAKSLGIPYCYTVVIETDSLKVLDDLFVDFNSTGKQLTPKENVNFFVSRGNHDYVVLKKVAKDYIISVNMAAKLLTGNMSFKCKDGLKYGKFKVTHRTFTIEILEEIKKMRKICPISVRKVHGFAMFYVTAKEYDSTKFMKALSITDTTKRLSEAADAKKFFLEVHNNSLKL